MKILSRLRTGERVCLCRGCELTTPKVKKVNASEGEISLSDGSVFTGLDLSGTHVVFGRPADGIDGVVYLSTYWDGLLDFFMRLASDDFRQAYGSDIRWNKAMSNINRYLFPHFTRLYRRYWAAARETAEKEKAERDAELAAMAAAAEPAEPAERRAAVTIDGERPRPRIPGKRGRPRKTAPKDV